MLIPIVIFLEAEILRNISKSYLTMELLLHVLVECILGTINPA